MFSKGNLVYIVLGLVLFVLLVLGFLNRDMLLGFITSSSSNSSSETTSSTSTSNLNESSLSSSTASKTSTLTSSIASTTTSQSGNSAGALSGSWQLLSASTSSKAGVDGTVRVGPYCQLASENLSLPDCTDASNQYKVAPNISIQVISNNTKNIVLSFKTNTLGQFKINLSTGKFIVRVVDDMGDKMAGIDDLMVDIAANSRQVAELTLKP